MTEDSLKSDPQPVLCVLLAFCTRFVSERSLLHCAEEVMSTVIPPADTGLEVTTRGRGSKATSSTSRNMSIIDGEYVGVAYTLLPRKAEGASLVTW